MEGCAVDRLSHDDARVVVFPRSGASISDLWSVLQPILSDVLSEEGLFATPLRQVVHAFPLFWNAACEGVGDDIGEYKSGLLR